METPTVRIVSPSLKDWYARLGFEPVVPVENRRPKITTVGSVPLKVYWLDLARVPDAARRRLDNAIAQRRECGLDEAHTALDKEGLPILAASAVAL